MNAPLGFALGVAFVFISGVLTLSIYNWRHLTLLEKEQLVLVEQIEQQDEVQKKLLNEITELMAEQEKTNRYLLKELENKMLTALEKKGHSVSHLNAASPSSGVVHGAAWPTAYVMTCAAVWLVVSRS